MRRSVTIIIASIIFCLPLVSIAAIDDTASTVLVTGANRGLGFEFARQYAADGWNVIATARKPDAAEDLQALAREYPQVVIEQLDVRDLERIDELAAKYADQPIDVLLVINELNSPPSQQSEGEEGEDDSELVDIQYCL